MEDGHFVHMVARPEGVPAAAPAAARASSFQELRNQFADRNAAHPDLEAEYAEAERILGHGGGLSDRLLRGGGGGGGGGVVADGGARDRDAFLNAAAGLEQGDFLSNMLLPRRRDGGGRGSQVERMGQADTALTRHGVRGHGGGGRLAAAAAAAAARAGEHESARQDGHDATAIDGGTNLEHVRQGLLTLHTLLSGTASRRRQELPLEPLTEAAAVR